jgi:hypothetical protein
MYQLRYSGLRLAPKVLWVLVMLGLDFLASVGSENILAKRTKIF